MSFGTSLRDGIMVKWEIAFSYVMSILMILFTGLSTLFTIAWRRFYHGDEGNFWTLMAIIIHATSCIFVPISTVFYWEGVKYLGRDETASGNILMLVMFGNWVLCAVCWLNWLRMLCCRKKQFDFSKDEQTLPDIISESRVL